MNADTQALLKRLVEQTNDAFDAAGGLNMDYAAFASLSLAEFKMALQDPKLTGRKLRSTIREGHNAHKCNDPKSCWATFVARHIANSSNQNLKEAMHFPIKNIYKEKP